MDKPHSNTYMLKQILLFACLSAVFYMLMAFVLHRQQLSNRRLMLYVNPILARIGGQEHLMTQDFDCTAAYDMVVVGSSHAYRGYDPRFFEAHGFSLFNCGSSAQHPRVSLQICTHLVAKLPSKPLVIVDVFDKILEMDGQESTGRMMVNCAQPDLAASILYDDFSVVAINNFVGRWCANHLKQEVEIDDYVGRGYCTRTGVLAKSPGPVNYAFEGNAQTRNDLQSCLQWLETNGYKFVLVSHPMPKQIGFDNYHLPSALFLKQLAANHHSCFFDFTMHSDFQEDYRFFSDETHLNQSGVELFNKLLLDSLHTAGFTAYGPQR